MAEIDEFTRTVAAVTDVMLATVLLILLAKYLIFHGPGFIAENEYFG